MNTVGVGAGLEIIKNSEKLLNDYGLKQVYYVHPVLTEMPTFSLTTIDGVSKLKAHLNILVPKITATPNSIIYDDRVTETYSQYDIFPYDTVDLHIAMQGWWTNNLVDFGEYDTNINSINCTGDVSGVSIGTVTECEFIFDDSDSGWLSNADNELVTIQIQINIVNNECPTLAEHLNYEMCIDVSSIT